jgi:hypothetical protein
VYAAEGTAGSMITPGSCICFNTRENEAINQPAYSFPIDDPILGRRVTRATANLPASTNLGIFTVAGGDVLVTALWGEVTTIIQNQACSFKFIHTPTVGTAVNLCDSTANTLANLEAGGRFMPIGPLATTDGAKTNAGASILSTTGIGWILPAGTIGMTTGATNTGQAKYVCYYKPLTPGATVVAA